MHGAESGSSRESNQWDWGGAGAGAVLTIGRSQQQAEFEAARPEREAARRIRDGWKVSQSPLPYDGGILRREEERC